MTNEQEHLTPETIDEQIEALAARLQFLPPEAPRTADLQVIEALQEVYADERRADAGSLAQTWQRLAARYKAAAHSQQPAPLLVQVRAEYERSFPMQIKKQIANWRERGFSRLAITMTVVALVALVSGLSIGVLLVRLPHPAPANVVTTVPTPFPYASASPYPTPFPSATTAPQSGNFLTTIQMLGTTTGWGLTSQDRVVRTTDGATTWQDVTPQGLGTPLAEVFLSAQVAWVASGTRADPNSGNTRPGDGTTKLFRTGDGGQTWQQSTLPFYLGQMTFVNAQDGWILVGQGVAAGSEGVDIYRTTNGGQTWKLVSSASPTANPGDPNLVPFSGHKAGMGFVNATTGWVTGDEPAPDFFYVYQTTDGGQTWHHQDLPLPSGVSNTETSVQPPTFVDAQNGFMRVNVALSTGDSQATFVLYVTHDTGKSWQPTNFLPAFTYAFLDGRQGWATDGTHLWMTVDGAQNWTVIPQADPFRDVSSLNFVSPTLGWALTSPSIGSVPTLLKTTDGGHTWQVVQPALP
jgi:photosystem II stability/assembly factor-like uncharacterized protein